MRAMFSGGIPGMPPAMGAVARRAAKSARGGKKGKKKPARSGDPRRAAELDRAASAQDQSGQTPASPGTGLGALPEGFPQSLADGLANLPPGLNFPPPAQDNIPAAFKRRDKKK